MSQVARDPGPMARLEDVKRDATAPSEIFRLLTADEPVTLAQVAKAWGVPKGRFVEWFTTTHGDLYDAALKVRAADLALDALQASLDATPDDVSVRKLQADVALRLASKFDRARFGETVRVEKSVTFGVDAGLLGTASELLRLVSSGRPLKDIECLPGEAGGAAEDVPPPSVAPARLPAVAEQAEEFLI